MPTTLTMDALGPYRVSPERFARLLMAREWISVNLVDAGPGLPPGRPRIAGLAGPENVVGVGIGLKLRGGVRLPEVAATVFVRRKLAPSVVYEDALVPRELYGIATDVQELGELRAGAEDKSTEPKPRTRYQTEHRPVVGGVSIGAVSTAEAPHPETGTVACFLRDAQGRFYVLGNNHVLANCNRTNPCNTYKYPPSQERTAIRQPGLDDDPKQETKSPEVAKLVTCIELYRHPKGGTNAVDVAIAELTTDSWNPGILRDDGSVEALGEPKTATLQMPVQKSGRSTGHTIGQVVNVAAEVTVSYGEFTAKFIDQLLIEPAQEGKPFSAEGDSGALVTSVDGNCPVGLLISAQEAKHTTANHFGMVLSKLAGAHGSALTVVRARS